MLHIMQSEPSMRLVLASARLAKAFAGGCKDWIEAEGLSGSDCGCGIRTRNSSECRTKDGAESEHETGREGRHDPFDQSTGMPAFQFWRQSLREAINADPFWGPEFADEIEERAARVERGFMALIAQSCALEEILAIIDDEDEAASDQTQSSGGEKNMWDASPVSKGSIPSPQSSISESSISDSASCRRSKGSPRLCFTPYHGHEGEVGIIRQGSVLAEKSMKGLGATVAGRKGWLNRVLVGCWTLLLTDAAAL